MAAPNEADWLENNTIKASTSHQKEKSKLRWYDGTSVTMEGRAFNDTETSYSRLESRRHKQVTRGVWYASRCSTGVTLRFVTDSPEIDVAWGKIKKAMPHMAWTGSGGVDLYARENGKWIYRGTGKPSDEFTSTSVQKSNGHKKLATEYLLFLPLYSPVDKLEIGINADCTIAAGQSRNAEELPLVFYGTSITQGGVASRAGMSHTGILRRWLDYPIVNLGFSGSGKCEPVMAEILSEIPAAAYVVETVSNMPAPMIKQRAVPFFKALRKKRPDTPILMVESPNAIKNADRNATWHKAYEQLLAGGMKQLEYLPGKGMYKSRENPTVDGVHPTTLGFYDMALTYEPVLQGLLDEPHANVRYGD